MLKHYSHIRMEAKRRALEGILPKKSETPSQAQVARPAAGRIPGTGDRPEIGAATVN
jgi:hypothetical protein